MGGGEEDLNLPLCLRLTDRPDPCQFDQSYTHVKDSPPDHVPIISASATRFYHNTVISFINIENYSYTTSSRKERKIARWYRLVSECQGKDERGTLRSMDYWTLT